ncbi:hypothetical protein AQPE_2328 [Aquipluma nitroreducens]|uniref:Uncharacterized protein n=1 Tax=Aquipluma nitroreducens TaxID=2010828 RepID=A0A5K7S9B5_9BACT|nr:hypothetical protein AQPE_2328 [Aquipluma nitroreducens]
MSKEVIQAFFEWFKIKKYIDFILKIDSFDELSNLHSE